MPRSLLNSLPTSLASGGSVEDQVSKCKPIFPDCGLGVRTPCKSRGSVGNTVRFQGRYPVPSRVAADGANTELITVAARHSPSSSTRLRT